MKITTQPATKLPQIIIHHKVAAYCRVSTQQEIPYHSLDAHQCCAYTEREIAGSRHSYGMGLPAMDSPPA